MGVEPLARVHGRATRTPGDARRTAHTGSRWLRLSLLFVFIINFLGLSAQRTQQRSVVAHIQGDALEDTVSILAEIPEELHESLQTFIETHPAWDQDRVYAAALSLFLLQNGQSQGDRTPSRVYLDTLFNCAR